MALVYQGHVFDSGRCACCDVSQRKVIIDPTATGKIRASFKATMALRWRRMRVLVRDIIIKHDLLQLQSPHVLMPAAPAINNASSKVAGFQRWFESFMDADVLGGDGSFMRPFVNQAYLSGATYGQRVVKGVYATGVSKHREDALFQLAVMELKGVMAAVSQQAVRVVTQGLLVSAQPMDIVRWVWSVIDKVGVNRSAAMIELLVVRAHAEATLDIFEAAKVQRVGLVPEARVVTKIGDAAGDRIGRSQTPSRSTIYRIKKQQRELEKRLGEQVNVVTAGDDDVCQRCEDIADGGPYTINEARSLIPAHPHCRCAFVPADDARFAAPDPSEWESEDHVTVVDINTRKDPRHGRFLGGSGVGNIPRFKSHGAMTAWEEKQNSAANPAPRTASRKGTMLKPRRRPTR